MISKRRTRARGWGMALVLALAAAPPLEAVETLKYKVMLQVSEDSMEQLMTALNAAKGLQEEYGAPHISVKIVAFGAGVQTLKHYAPIPVANRVRQARTNGVQILVCDQSLRAAKLRPSDMLQEVSFVRSGAGEIMEGQQQGWAYLRP